MVNANTFTNLIGYNGGAIFIFTDLNYKNILTNVSYSISGISIQNCTAILNGGGVFLRNIRSLRITDSNIT